MFVIRFVIVIVWQVRREGNSLSQSKMSEYDGENEASIGRLEEVDLYDDDSDDSVSTFCFVFPHTLVLPIPTRVDITSLGPV